MSTLSLLCCNLNSTLAALSPVDIEKLISFLAEVSFMYLKSADLVLGREKNQKKKKSVGTPRSNLILSSTNPGILFQDLKEA